MFDSIQGLMMASLWVAALGIVLVNYKGFTAAISSFGSVWNTTLSTLMKAKPV